MERHIARRVSDEDEESDTEDERPHWREDDRQRHAVASASVGRRVNEVEGPLGRHCGRESYCGIHRQLELGL
jgi:hypothetical protein